MLKMRPLLGSLTTTDPFSEPSASTAAARTAGSSPFRSSPSSELPLEARSITSFHGPRGRREAPRPVLVRTALFTATPVAARAVRRCTVVVWVAAGFLAATDLREAAPALDLDEDALWAVVFFFTFFAGLVAWVWVLARTGNSRNDSIRANPLILIFSMQN